MSLNPFAADSKIRLRCEEIGGRIGPRLIEDAERCLGAAEPDSRGMLIAEDSRQLISTHALSGIDELMLLLLPLAMQFARPVLSQFQVGAIGLEHETGNLLLGGNIEFPGTHMGLTIHGETCLAARSFSRGTSLSRIALTEAHPCGHCRQFLSEFASAPDLRLIDPLGHVLALADLMPWPFDPAYLGDQGARPGVATRPDLALDGTGPVVESLVEAGRRAHAPYTNNQAAALCVMGDGLMFGGQSIESVAYNPSMGPLQVAIINLTAAGYAGSDIAEIHLAERMNGTMVHADEARLLGARFAPHARLVVHHWS